MSKKASFLMVAFIVVLIGCNSKSDIQNQKVKNIILMIGDGFDLAQIDSSYIANNRTSNLQKVVSKGFFTAGVLSTDSKDLCHDAAILAIGKRSNYRTIGLDSEGIAHPNILELASFNGMSTGLVTSSSAIHDTPASFIVHAVDKNQYESIASEYLNSPIDVFIGCGLKYFTQRSDGANLVQRLKNKGFIVYQEVESLPASKLMILLDENQNQSDKNIGSQQLLKYSDLAIQSLSPNQKGFILVIDDTHSDNICTVDYCKGRLSEFDKSIGHVFDFADKTPGTLVIVTTNFNSRNSEISVNGNIKQTNDKSKSFVGVYAYGAMANSFVGTYDNTEVFNKIVSLLKLDIQ